MKRKKQEADAAAKQGASQQEKEDEIEQVAGNAEDDIGEHIKHVREEELLYGDRSLLKVYGPLLVYVCGSPQIYKVRLIARTLLGAITDVYVGRYAARSCNSLFCEIPLRLR